MKGELSSCVRIKKHSSIIAESNQFLGSGRLTIVDALQQHARERGSNVACTLYTHGHTQALTYSELDRRAREYACYLKKRFNAGNRVVLVYCEGGEFLVAYVACLYAGLVAVPVGLCGGANAGQRIAAVYQDSDACVIVGTEDACAQLRINLEPFVRTRSFNVVTYGQLRGDAASYECYGLSGHELAHLDYGLGGCEDLRGVMVSHSDLEETWVLAIDAHDFSPADVMINAFSNPGGLIYGTLMPLFAGGSCHQVSMLGSVSKPLSWLTMLSRVGGTHAAVPAYLLESSKHALMESNGAPVPADLGNWRALVTGADSEPFDFLAQLRVLRPESGLDTLSVHVNYGGQEAGWLRSTAVASPCSLLDLNKEPLYQHEVVAPRQSIRSRSLVPCGRADQLGAVAVVKEQNCDDFAQAATGRIGEIWISGCRTRGYWRQPKATVDTFVAYCNAESETATGPYLRTGDLGFVHEGNLFVIGRADEVIHASGLTFYPQEFEEMLAACVDAFLPASSAVFTAGDDSALVLVQEVRAEAGGDIPAATPDLFAKLQKHLADRHTLTLETAVLVGEGTIPRTGYGAVDRKLCRRLFETGCLSGVVATWGADYASSTGNTSDAPVEFERVAQLVAAELGVSRDQLQPEQPLAHYGMHSLAAVSLSETLARELGIALPSTLLYDYPCLSRLVAYLRRLTGHEKLSVSSPATLAKPSAPATTKVAGSVSNTMPIAVIGMACRLPGADHYSQLWQLIQRGEACSSMPAERKPSVVKPGNYFEDVSLFDAAFFGISPNEARYMDPQQRLLLEVALDAFWDAAIATTSLAKSRTGVFVGISPRDYERLMFEAGIAPDRHIASGNAASIAANRISYLLDLQGPSLAIDTACSSSLVAVHQAVMSLRSGECSLALAGGVNLAIDPRVTEGFDLAQMLSPDGLCKSFDVRADGYGRGEGCAVVLLKPLAAAEADGDPIHGLIVGTAINQDGRSNGMTAPSCAAQEQVICSALAASNTSASEIGYIEAHGSGTALGDPIEWQALSTVFASTTAPYVGSIKGNFGHTEVCSGIFGLLRALLTCKHGVIAPQSGFAQLNPRIQAHDALRVPEQCIEWPTGDSARERKRKAGVSSFGFGGTNAHVVVSSHVVAPPVHPRSEIAVPALLSAPSGPRLKVLANRLLSRFSEAGADPVAWQDLCTSLACGRDHHRHRLAVIASRGADAAQALSHWLDGQADSRVLQHETSSQTPTLAFLFPGQGNLRAGMGAVLHRTLQPFRDIVTAADAPLHQHWGVTLDELLSGDDSYNTIAQQTGPNQLVTVALSYAIAQLLKRWGVDADALLGHSVGEWTAAAVAEMLPYDRCLEVVGQRGCLLQTLPPGAMVSVAGETDAVMVLTEGLAIDQAGSNGPDHVTLAGSVRDVDEICQRLAEHKISYRRLSVSHAFHSRDTAPILDSFERCVAEERFFAPRSLVYANVTGKPHQGVPQACYWRRHLREPVKFGCALSHMKEQGVSLCVQVGPGRGLLAQAREVIDGPILATLAVAPGADDWLTLSQTLCELHGRGVPVAWNTFFEDLGGRRLSGLPSYPFDRQSFWFDARH